VNNTARTAIYIKSTIKYERLQTRGLNRNIIIIKITQQNMPQLFISAIYRPWKNIDGLSQDNAFSGQVEEMKRLIPRNSECMVFRDFNINYKKRNNRNMVNRNLNQILNHMVKKHLLGQVVRFDTWSRRVNI